MLGAGWPDGAAIGLRAAGVVLGVLGALLVGWGARSLGPSLTPLPRPREGAALAERGAYRLVRHPLYGGVLVLGLGFALATTPLALAPVAALAVFFSLKSRREEAWLLRALPGYSGYAERVRRRFLPGLW